MHAMKVSEQIRIRIEDSISAGRLLPGDPIDESALAAEFEVSRTPVREALLQLQAQGWLSSLPRGGMFVAKMTLQQLLSLWELLAELEGVAARLACDRMTDAQVQALRAQHDASLAIVEAEDLAGWQQANSAFHELIYAGARNPYLRQEVLRIRFRTGVYRRHAFAALGRLQASFDQHQRVVEAFSARRAEAAAAQMVDHMRPGRDARSLNDFVVNLPSELLATV
jgi:DNA-binding GntR family transcriptional regulator